MTVMHMTLVLLANLAMLGAGYIYGIKFLRQHHNFLLGFEWLVIALSGTNVLLLAAIGVSHESFSYHLMVFLDSFTRSFGTTLIFVLGMLVVTHRYRPHWSIDALVIGAGIAVGPNRSLDIRPISIGRTVFYTVTNLIVAVFMIYVAARLFRIGERAQGVWVSVATVLGAVVAVSYDFVHIPGDDTDRTLFYSIAMAVWALMLVTYYYGYRALDAQQQTLPRAFGSTLIRR